MATRGYAPRIATREACPRRRANDRKAAQQARGRGFAASSAPHAATRQHRHQTSGASVDGLASSMVNAAHPARRTAREAARADGELGAGQAEMVGRAGGRLVPAVVHAWSVSDRRIGSTKFG